MSISVKIFWNLLKTVFFQMLKYTNSYLQDSFFVKWCCFPRTKKGGGLGETRSYDLEPRVLLYKWSYQIILQLLPTICKWDCYYCQDMYSLLVKFTTSMAEKGICVGETQRGKISNRTVLLSSKRCIINKKQHPIDTWSAPHRTLWEDQPNICKV